MNRKKKKQLGIVICIVILFVAIASLFYIAEEENHICTGEDCPICVCVHQTEQTLRNFGTGLVTVFCLNPVSVMTAAVCVFCAWMLLSSSLVNQKVRLND